MAKELVELLKGLKNYTRYNTSHDKISGSKKLRILDISDDSRKVKKGSLFVAIKGLKVDAHKFIPRAIGAGATVIVGEKEPEENWLDKTTYIKVPDSRRALGLLASTWYDQPSKKLKVIGVTGTDGKTTTATLIYWILKKAGRKTGLISTVSAKIGEKEFETGLHVTNPEPLKLQEFLAKMVETGCQYAVLEVTSHGLDQERVAGIKFDIGVLTNITHEHLDYHKNWQAYRRAKAKLFERVRLAVLNKDDKSFNYLSRFVPKKGKIISYALKKPADWNPEDVSLPKTKFLAEYNLANALAAVAVVRELSIPKKEIEAALASFKLPAGRLEKVDEGQDFNVYIDFAHTPNALEKVLSHLKKKTRGRLIAVFGCAGERDRLKRSMMGQISTKIADISIFTAEDPRGENVNKIIMEMAEGAFKNKALETSPSQPAELKKQANKHWFIRIPERGEAISYAIQKLAKPGDIVVVCGKGHEKSMAYDHAEYPWSDKEAVKMALQGRVKKIGR